MAEKFNFLLLLLATFGSLSAGQDELTVQTAKGPVRGTTLQSAQGKSVDAFLGIPYAKPPVGNLRFSSPEPVDPWSDVLEATTLPNACIQINDTFFGDFEGATVWNPNTPISEDCLYVNVYIPKPRPEGSPVMVWIYGGGFYSGSSALDLYDMTMLSSEEQIIVVSLNYRLGSLGFLYFDRPDVPGNVGLLDQVMALEWVRDNIASFGGNPNNVTIFGESAGAGSVGLHLMSPLSRNLYSKAILQSGAPITPWAVAEKEVLIQHGLNLATNLGCPNDRSNIDAVLECLRTKDPFEMMSLEWKNLDLGIVEFPFSPTIDGKFLTKLPRESIATKDVKNGPILLGGNAQEGSVFVIYYLTQYFKKRENVTLNREQFTDCVNTLTSRFGDAGQEAISFLYTDWTDIEDPVKNRDAIIQMVGDWKFTCPVIDLGRRYAEIGNDVYMYYFSHRATPQPWPGWMGVMHGDEVNFVFGQPLRPEFRYATEEQELSRKIMRYWANFAKTGNPNIRADGGHELALWPLHTAHGREYLTLSADSSEIGRARKARECKFWDHYLPELVKFADECENKI